MKLSIRQLKLQADVIRDNKSMIKQLAQNRLNRIALVIGRSPNDKLIIQINDALSRNVKVLKTTDSILLNLASTIEKHFGLKVQDEISSQNDKFQ
jgi:DNA-binding MurR/RpiR family transcriptional regulator